MTWPEVGVSRKLNRGTLLTMHYGKVIHSCPTVCLSVPECLWTKQSQIFLKVINGLFFLRSFPSNFLSRPFHFCFQSEIRVRSCNINKQCPLPYMQGPLSSQQKLICFGLEDRSSSVVNKGFWSIKGKPLMWLLHILETTDVDKVSICQSCSKLLVFGYTAMAMRSHHNEWSGIRFFFSRKYLCSNNK